MSTRLKETGLSMFKDFDINLEKMQLEVDNAELYQMNPKISTKRRLTNACEQ